uniref:serine/threonine-protein kinase-like protein CCR4 n=1 Tax=Erigeron canadensis TaxID=72917 RepID=UPI001CB8C54C|nr:serine/threonine-protein kinase-like protein CCR4 [Erigeron canadensis]
MATSKFLYSLTLFILLINIPTSISTLPTVSISYINPNQTLICAITKSPTTQQPSNLNCTGYPSPFNVGIIPRYSYVGIVGGNRFLCALTSTSVSSLSILVCWRFFEDGSTVFKRIYRGPSLKDIDSSDSHVCGIVSTTNELFCWQWDQFNDNLGLNQTRFYSSVAVGENYVCGLFEIGNISCKQGNINKSNSISNSNSNIITDVPRGNYSVVSTGYNRVCAINSSRGLDCWGEAMIGRKPNGEFKAISIGENRFCAVRNNGTVICWGENDFSLPENLREVSFEGLKAKRGVFCGLSTANYSLYCWGNESLNNNSNAIVFGNVVPGLCTNLTTCDCGPIPNYATFCSQGLIICRICEPDRGLIPELVPPPDGSKNGGLDGKMVAFVVVGSVGSLLFILVLVFLVFRYCRSSEGSRVHDSGPMEEIRVDSQVQNPNNRVLVKKLSHLISMGNGGHLEEFSLQRIIDATDNFSEEHRIGVGSFGSVYRGLLTDGRKVAIKRAELTSSSSYTGGFKKHQEDTNNAFVNELEFLSRVNHKNLVQLLGFCEENNELVLVYEFMENGSLHEHLHKTFGSHIMSWPARIKVALDAARGIEYLHVYAQPPIIHRDIKSSNILLDEEWNGKVSDFGLSLLGPPDNVSHLSLRAAGTVGYMDPEYFKFEQLTAKSDVYSFGIVLLELLSGHRAIQKNEAGERRNVVDSVVPYIVRDEIHRILDHKVPPPTPYEIEAVKYVGYVAVDCVTLEGRDRPTMSELVACLERALSACLTIPCLSPGSSNDSSNDISHVSL